MPELHPPVLVLWGNRCEEVTVGLLVAALRRSGIDVQIIGVSGRPMAGAYGVTLVPDATLDDVLPMTGGVRCVIIPCSTCSLHTFRRDPRLENLLDEAHAQDALFVVCAKSAVAWKAIVYPTRAALIAFAQTLARQIVLLETS